MGITHSWDGTVLTITSDSGTSSADLKGEKGDMGVRGPQGVGGKDGNVAFSDLTDEQKQSLQVITHTSQLINDGDGNTIPKYLGEDDVRQIAAAADTFEFIQGYQAETSLSDLTFKLDNGNESILDCTKPVMVVVELPAAATLSSNLMAIQFSFSNNRSAAVRAFNWRTSTMETSAVWSITKRQGYWWFEVNPYDKEVTTIAGDLRVASDTDMLRYVKITTAIPQGTSVSIWGTPK